LVLIRKERVANNVPSLPERTHPGRVVEMRPAFQLGEKALLGLMLATTGCASTTETRSNSGSPANVPAEPPVQVVLPNYEPPPLTTPSIIVSGTSPEVDELLNLSLPPSRSGNGLGELPTCSINPILALLAGDTNPQRNQDAFDAMGMLVITSAIHILRRIGSDGDTPAEMHFHRSAAFLDDLLQPDDDTMRSKQIRPPCFFTLGFQF
jgi:hypothetical protein